ncbi:MAG TPA: iron-containing alcohol dehydrogenase, partial [Dehalococcoidia bacterium]|nr:iron-containing alcohol dehydrogenase [Dehalococcoidia bacterium]
MEIFPFATAKKILFGTGAVEQLGKEVKNIGAKKVAIITGPVIKKTGVLDKVTNVLKKTGLDCEIWDKVESEPSVEVGEAAIQFTREGKYDGVIGLGGGSVMDTA